MKINKILLKNLKNTKKKLFCLKMLRINNINRYLQHHTLIQNSQKCRDEEIKLNKSFIKSISDLVCSAIAHKRILLRLIILAGINLFQIIETMLLVRKCKNKCNAINKKWEIVH